MTLNLYQNLFSHSQRNYGFWIFPSINIHCSFSSFVRLCCLNNGAFTSLTINEMSECGFTGEVPPTLRQRNSETQLYLYGYLGLPSKLFKHLGAQIIDREKVRDLRLSKRFFRIALIYFSRILTQTLMGRPSSREAKVALRKGLVRLELPLAALCEVGVIIVIEFKASSVLLTTSDNCSFARSSSCTNANIHRRAF